MGDRCLVLLTDGKEVSPTIYLHWAGEGTTGFIKELKELMKDRTGDIQYAAARFTGICHSHDIGCTGLGLWNTTESDKKAVIERDESALKEMSHGDAGVIVVNVDDFTWEAFGGYLAKDKAA